jgi:hypothetical protein
MSYAPVILFAYSRAAHTQRVLEALAKNAEMKETLLYVFVDGPKENATPEALKKNEEVIALFSENRWAKDLKVEISKTNKGLAKSIVQGVTKVLELHEKVIVLEDDIVTSPQFLGFMNEGLDRYQNSDQVACISGYVYPLRKSPKTAFFILGADCWGWATWKHQWTSFIHDVDLLIREVEKPENLSDFTFKNTYPYLEMLKDRAAGRNQSWAIQWYAGAFINRKLCLYPAKSLVSNIGNDGTGTHNVEVSHTHDTTLQHQEIIWPAAVEDSAEGRKAFEDFFKSSRKISFFFRLKRFLKRL